MVFIDLRCRMKTGSHCSAVLSFDEAALIVPRLVLKDLEESLAPCLGRGWLAQMPKEDPFG
jgi:hypothetical protein